MGTFHRDTHALHGLTVAITTPGGRVYVGRFHEQDERRVLLLDVDWHDGDGADEYIRRCAQRGVWIKEKTFELPVDQVGSITRLCDL